MASRIVGLDFGTRSIKLVELNVSERTVTTWDEEPLPLGDRRYLPDESGSFGPDDEPGNDETEQTGAEESAAEAEAADGSTEESRAQDPTDIDGPATGGDGWLDRLRALLDRHDFDEDTVVVSYLPDGRGLSVHQDVPFPEPDQVASVLPNMLQDRLPMSPSEIVYDFNILDADEADQKDEDDAFRSIVGIGRKRDLAFFLDRLERAGVNPIHLGLPELMLRYTMEATVAGGGASALVDLGHRFTRVLVLDDGDPVMARSFQFGGWDLTKAIAEEFDITLEQAEAYKERTPLVDSGDARDEQTAAISETIKRKMRSLIRDLRRQFKSLYAEQRVQVDAIHICGGTSQIDHLEAYLSGELGVDVRSLNVGQLDALGTIPDEDLPKAALPMGLALQQVRDRSAKRMLDLRQDEFAYAGRSEFLQGQLVKYGAIAAALFILFLGTLFARNYELQAKKEAMRKAVTTQSQELLGQSITDPNLIRKRAAGGAGSQRAFVPEMSAYQLFYELISRTTEDMKLEMDRLDVDIDRNIVQMAGITSDPQTVDKLVSDLEKLDCIKAVNKKPVTVKSENEAEFRLEITSGCS
jgi:Tfp pilus assembly PilM family ATPase